MGSATRTRLSRRHPVTAQRVPRYWNRAPRATGSFTGKTRSSAVGPQSAITILDRRECGWFESSAGMWGRAPLMIRCAMNNCPLLNERIARGFVHPRVMVITSGGLAFTTRFLLRAPETGEICRFVAAIRPSRSLPVTGPGLRPTPEFVRGHIRRGRVVAPVGPASRPLPPESP